MSVHVAGQPLSELAVVVQFFSRKWAGIYVDIPPSIWRPVVAEAVLGMLSSPVELVG